MPLPDLAARFVAPPLERLDLGQGGAALAVEPAPAIERRAILPALYSGVVSVLQTAGFVRSWKEIRKAYLFLALTVGVVTPLMATLALAAPIDFKAHEGDLITHYATLLNGVPFGVAVAALASFTLMMAVNTAFVASSELMERVAHRYGFHWLIATNRRQSLYRIHLLSATFFSIIIFITRGSQSLLADMYALGLIACFCINMGALIIYRYFMGTKEIQYTTSRLGTLILWVIGDASVQGPIEVPVGVLQPGENLIAVEVHQQSTTSSDVVFGLRLDGVILTNPPVLAGVVLNEVMANNRSVTNADGTITDWVELYNPSATPVDLAQMSLTDQTDNARRWVFPTGSVAPAFGHLTVRFDPDRPATTNASPILNTGFGLKATGDALYLFNRPTDGGEFLDAITFGLQAPDWSIGRVPDGASNWVLNIPTLRSPNLAAALGDPTRLKVNEWMANPAREPGAA